MSWLMETVNKDKGQSSYCHMICISGNISFYNLCVCVRALPPFYENYPTIWQPELVNRNLSYHFFPSLATLWPGLFSTDKTSVAYPPIFRLSRPLCIPLRHHENTRSARPRASRKSLHPFCPVLPVVAQSFEHQAGLDPADLKLSFE